MARAGLYWRRGSTVTPGVMTLDAGTLSFATDHEVVLHAPVERVSAVFSRFGTLSVTVDGRTLHFVTGAYAGAFAGSFSAAQLELLAGSAHGSKARETFRDGAAIIVSSSVARSLASIAGGAAGAALASAGDAVGVAFLFRSQAQSFALARAWAQHLAENGVPVRMKGTTFVRSQLVVAAIVLPAVAVFGVGTAVLITALSGS